MTCSRERISHYLDGELPPRESAEISTHLETCQQCAADLAAYRWIGSQIRQSGERRAPASLRSDVFQRVAAAQRQRLAWGSSRLFAPILTASVALLVVGGLVTVWRLVPAGSAPVMTAAFTVQDWPEEPAGLRIQLVFDRPIEPSSLAGAVVITPPLSFSQRVVDNKVELVPREPVTPGQSFRIVVSNVRDQRGHSQAEPVVFSLTTGATATLEQESTPAPVAVAPSGPERAAAAPLTSTPAPAAAAKAPTVSAPAGQSSEAAPGPASMNRVSSTGTAPLPPAAAGPPGGAAKLIARFLETAGSPRDRLGAQIGPEYAVQLAEQSFQSGLMFYRGESNQIFVLYRGTGRWHPYASTWRPGEVLPSAGQRPPGTLDPMRMFGKLWREQPSVKNELGWPVYEERSAVGQSQLFDRGMVVRSAYGIFYVLFSDGSWRTYPEPVK